MSKSVLVAGATGAIGQVLCTMLVNTGWQVTGTTRSVQKVPLLAQQGVIPIVVDVFNAGDLEEAMHQAKPDVVIHQLTDLPKTRTPESMAAAMPRNARIREIGTANLVKAAVTAGARRIVAQSIAFGYAPGPQPHTEADPLDLTIFSSVKTLEDLVLDSGLEALVLRYGRLYGPNTWAACAPDETPLHVDEAARAALLAATQGPTGIYNIAEDDGSVTIEKARQYLGWRPGG